MKSKGKELNPDEAMWALNVAINSDSYDCARLLMPYITTIHGVLHHKVALAYKLVKEFPNRVQEIVIVAPELHDSSSDEDDDEEEEKWNEEEIEKFKKEMTIMMNAVSDLIALNQPQLQIIDIQQLEAWLPTSSFIDTEVLKKLEGVLETNYHFKHFGLLSALSCWAPKCGRVSDCLLYKLGHIDGEDIDNDLSISMTEILENESYLVANYLFRNECIEHIPLSGLVLSLIELWRESLTKGDMILGSDNDESKQVRVHSFVVNARAKPLSSPQSTANLSPMALRLLSLHLYTGLGPYLFIMPNLIQHKDLDHKEVKKAAKELQVRITSTIKDLLALF